MRSGIARMSLAVVAILAMTLAIGCPASAYGCAMQLALDVTDTLHTGADTVDQLRAGGTLSVTDERIALNVMLALNAADGAYGQCVEQAHLANGKAAQVLACATAFGTAANDPQLLAQIRIINPASQAKVMAIDTTVVTLINVAITGIQNLQAKGQ